MYSRDKFRADSREGGGGWGGGGVYSRDKFRADSRERGGGGVGGGGGGGGSVRTWGNGFTWRPAAGVRGGAHARCGRGRPRAGAYVRRDEGHGLRAAARDAPQHARRGEHRRLAAVAVH